MKKGRSQRNKTVTIVFFIILIIYFFSDILIDEEVNDVINNSIITENGGVLEVYFLDVGQGDSIYIKTPFGDDILIDAGENSYGDDVVKYLNDLGVDDIEVMIATHPHSDHIGGLDVVLESYKVESVYAPEVGHTSKSFEDFVGAVNDEGLSIISATSGVEIPLMGVEAVFVGPVKEYDDLNNASAVLHLTYGDNEFLFTGDAEEESEKDIIASDYNIEADVLKVGHHGSVSSSSKEFLDEVQPSYAIISVGVDNDYGHPHDEILEQFSIRKIEVLRTDLLGTIVVTSDGQNISLTTLSESFSN